MRSGPCLFVCLFVCLLFVVVVVVVVVFFFLRFSLFKTTKICFGSTKMEICYREKAFQAGKNIRKNYFAPQKNFPVTPLMLGI